MADNIVPLPREGTRRARNLAGARQVSAAGIAGLTREFLRAGGRVLVSPQGAVEIRIDVGLIYASGIDEDLAEQRLRTARMMLKSVRQLGGATYAKRAARRAGRVHAGWHILSGDARP